MLGRRGARRVDGEVSGLGSSFVRCRFRKRSYGGRWRCFAEVRRARHDSPQGQLQDVGGSSRIGGGGASGSCWSCRSTGLRGPTCGCRDTGRVGDALREGRLRGVGYRRGVWGTQGFAGSKASEAWESATRAGKGTSRGTVSSPALLDAGHVLWRKWS